MRHHPSRTLFGLDELTIGRRQSASLLDAGLDEERVYRCDWKLSLCWMVFSYPLETSRGGAMNGVWLVLSVFGICTSVVTYSYIPRPQKVAAHICFFLSSMITYLFWIVGVGSIVFEKSFTMSARGYFLMAIIIFVPIGWLIAKHHQMPMPPPETVQEPKARDLGAPE